MDLRVYEADAIATPPSAPASPSTGYPTNGNPLAAQNATEPGDYWFYQLSEEMRALILEGGLTPDHTSLTQLRDAIKNIVKGGDYKASVRVASTAAINLAAPGANIDGVAMVAGDRFLEKDNATLADRGIYIWNGAAVPATRALDADSGAEFNGGAIIPVEQGTVNADTNWQVTNDGVVTIGVTGLTFKCIETKLFTGSNQLINASGYQKFPGGFIFQWMQVTGSSASALYPIAFPNAALAINASVHSPNFRTCAAYLINSSTFGHAAYQGDGGAGAAEPLTIFAVGN